MLLLLLLVVGIQQVVGNKQATNALPLFYYIAII
jgi:hypothetical protein